MKRFSSPIPIAGALQEALREYGIERKMREQELLTRWVELAGTAVSNHASPSRFRDGILTLRVSDAAWRQELSLRREELRRMLNEALHDEIVMEVVFR